MTTLPPELAAFSDLLDAQPAPVRDAFNYCLCVLMVQAGKMHLVEKVPGEKRETQDCFLKDDWGQQVQSRGREYGLERRP